ncbi:NADH-quinone oxidoreductase subunit N [Acidobacteriota bacterium]
MISPPDINLGMLLPVMILAGAGVVVLLLSAFSKALNRISGLLALLATITALILTFNNAVYGRSEVSFVNIAVVDGYALAFDITLLIAATLSILFSMGGGSRLNRGEYYCLFLFAVTGMMIMAHSVHMLTLFVGLETLSVSLYALTGFDKRNPRSSEAALKYFLLGAFASAFLLFGIALMYGATGKLVFTEIATQLASPEGPSTMALMGVGFMIVGLGFKLSVVPFHMWTPDAYDGAPTPVAGLMSVGTKAAVFAALLRLLMIGLPGLAEHTTTIFYALAILTMTVGNIIALTQRNIKRMLAFSSIAHAGYMLVGVVAGRSLGSPGIIYYLLAYTFMNIGAFGIVVVLERGQKQPGDPELAGFTLSDLIGLGRERPVLAAAMALFMFSLTGIPPTAGFVGKFYIFAAAVKEGFVVLAVLGVLNSAVAAYYYLRVVVTMYMKEQRGEPIPTTSPVGGSLALLLCSAGVLVLGLAPARIYQFMASVVEKL